MCLYTPIVPSKTIPDSKPKCIPVFRPKRPKNHTLWGGTYPHMAHIREYSPPALYRSFARVVSFCHPGKDTEDSGINQ